VKKHNYELIISEIELANDQMFDIELHMQREDLIHPFVSGNKYRKLKYNLAFAKKQGYKGLLSFGGAYSNHISAMALAGSIEGFKTIGVIRGEELYSQIDQNETLSFAKSCGMEFDFLSREVYKTKDSDHFLEAIKDKYPEYYIVPEGGTNTLAIKGCEEILQANHNEYDYICVSVGTGGTVAGIVNTALDHQTVVGFSALKGTFQKELIKNHSANTRYQLTDEFCFGGYAKVNASLIEFMNEFRNKNQICLDPIYTGKMMYGILAMIRRGDFPKNSRILAIHTGGLQGIAGMNTKLKKKNLPLINV